MKDYQKLQKLDRYLQIFRRSGIYDRPSTTLSDADIMVLFCIGFSDRGQNVKLTDIAKTLHVTLPAVTHKVNDLVQQGFIEKEASKKDLRVTIVKLTEKGESYVSQVEDNYYATLEKLIEKLGTDDTDTLIRLLEKISQLGKIQ